MPLLSLFLAFVVVGTLIVSPVVILRLVYELKELVSDLKDLICEVKYKE